jgi:putative Ca2+/H+ antiporter (TMEM165/GDT1 family)
MLYAFLVATILITLAELGDKTQLLALALATRYRWWQVLIGIFVATLAVHLFSTLLGQVIGNLLSGFWLGIITGLLFVGFGIWTLRGDSVDDEDTDRSGGRYGAIVTTAIAFFLAELGDKTQIMTTTIAADPAAVLRGLGGFGPAVAGWLGSMGITGASLTPVQVFWGVWMGSTLGMMIADGIAIVAGVLLGKALPEKAITRVSGILFIVFGLISLAGTVYGALR